MPKCQLCGKGPVAGKNVPKSMHKTNRMIQPNIQKFNGVKVCTRCLRTIKSVGRSNALEQTSSVE